MSVPTFLSIHTFANGQPAPAKVTQLHEPYGPFVLNGKRLDLLEQVEVVLDSSTKTSTQTGNTESSAKTGNMVKRAVVGGVLLGGAGAAIGAVTGKREGTVEAVTEESLNTKLTLKLIFEDGSTQHALVNNLETYHWLIAQAENPATSDAELQAAEQKAGDDRRYREAISKIERPVYNAQKLRKLLDRGLFLLAVFISAIISFKLAFAVVAAYVLVLMFGKSFLDSKGGTDEQKHAEYVSKISSYMGKPCEIPFPNQEALADKQTISGIFTFGFVFFVLLISKAAHNSEGSSPQPGAKEVVSSTQETAPASSQNLTPEMFYVKGHEKLRPRMMEAAKIVAANPACLKVTDGAISTSKNLIPGKTGVIFRVTCEVNDLTQPDGTPLPIQYENFFIKESELGEANSIYRQMRRKFI